MPDAHDGVWRLYTDAGLRGLTDRSRRQYRRANQLPVVIEETIVRLKREHRSRLIIKAEVLWTSCQQRQNAQICPDFEIFPTRENETWDHLRAELDATIAAPICELCDFPK